MLRALTDRRPVVVGNQYRAVYLLDHRDDRPVASSRAKNHNRARVNRGPEL